jgi:hypothetical protein
MIPESAIIRSLKELRSDRFYLLVYIRPKSDPSEGGPNEDHVS